MANDPVLIAYAVTSRDTGSPPRWTKIGAAFPHAEGAGLTVVIHAAPFDGRIVLLEPDRAAPM